MRNICFFLSLILLSACAPDAPPANPPPSRVNAVIASGAEISAKTWCDVYKDKGRGPKLSLPPHETARAQAGPAGMPSDKWVWINFWATWCGPCLREMPLIDKWAESLRNRGLGIDLWYVSVDESLDVLRSFLVTHPAVAPNVSLRFFQPTALGEWLAPYGIAKDTAIPINVLLGPGGELRCIRTGAIAESDFSVVRDLIAN